VEAKKVGQETTMRPQGKSRWCGFGAFGREHIFFIKRHIPPSLTSLKPIVTLMHHGDFGFMKNVRKLKKTKSKKTGNTKKKGIKVA
jgi:hypothetical protein